MRRSGFSLLRSAPAVIAFFIQIGGVTVAARGEGIWIPGPGSPSLLGSPPAQEFNAVAADPGGSRIFAFGGYPPPTSDLWMLDTAAPTPTWHFVAPASPGPGPRTATSIVFDSRRQRLLLMGGSTTNFSRTMNDVWSFSLTDGSGWQQILPTGVLPTSRGWHSAVYDSLRDRLVIVDGNSGSGSLDDVWALDLTGGPHWTRLGTGGSTPGPRYQSSLALDRDRDRLVLEGGLHGPGIDVWALPLVPGATWSPLVCTGLAPTVRSGAMGAYDGRRNALVVCGGDVTSAEAYDSTFTLAFGDTSTWSVATGPAILRRWYNGSAAYDIRNDRICVLGGIRDAWYEDEACAWDSTSAMWRMLRVLGTPDHPSVRVAHAAATAGHTHELVLAGGRRGDGARGLDDLWRLDLVGGGWSTSQPGGDVFAGRYDHGMTWDPFGDRVLAFGGAPNTPNQALALDLAGAGTWHSIAPPGALPTIDGAVASAFDTARRRLLAVSGTPTGGWQVWALPSEPGSSWTNLTASAATPFDVVWGRMAAYDPFGDEVLVIGGDPAQVWALGLADLVWKKLGTATGPSLRIDAALAFDPVGRRLWIHGGTKTGMVFQSETWRFDLSNRSWTVEATAGQTPPAREKHTLTYDPFGNRLVLFGGFNGLYLSDTWYLQLDNPTATLVSSRIEVVTQRSARIAWRLTAAHGEYEVQRQESTGGWVMRGRAMPDGSGDLRWTDEGLQPGTVYEYRLVGPTGEAVASSGIELRTPDDLALALRSISPQPANAVLRVRFSTADPAPIRFELHDVAGRRVRAQTILGLPRGEHEKEFPLSGLSAGVYFLSVEQAGSSLRRRCVVAR